MCNITKIDKEQIIVRETCAFDSIFQIVASDMDMRNAYKTDITAFITYNTFIKLIIDVLTHGKITTNDCSTRAMILCNIL